MFASLKTSMPTTIDILKGLVLSVSREVQKLFERNV